MNATPSFSLRKFALALAIAILAGSSMKGAVLLEYGFTGNSSTIAEPTMEATEITGSNTTWVGMTGDFSTGSNTAYATASNVAESFSSGQYFEFTMTADENFVMDLDSLEFTMGGTNASGSFTYTVNANVRSNENAYGSNLTINPGAVTTATHTTAVGNNTSYSTFTVDLSGAGFDSLETITFRLYPSDSSTASNNFYRYSNITVNGEVAAIPEPGTTTFLVCGLAALFLRRRSRRTRH